MPSTPIAPHLFPRIIIIITSLFTAHLPLPPPHPEWHSGKGDGGINTEQLLPAALLPHTFPVPSMGLPQVLQSFRKYHMLQSGLHGLLGHNLLHCGPSAWDLQHLVHFSHLSVTGLVLAFFLPPYCCAMFCPFSKVLSVSVPRDSAMPCGGWVGAAWSWLCPSQGSTLHPPTVNAWAMTSCAVTCLKPGVVFM